MCLSGMWAEIHTQGKVSNLKQLLGLEGSNWKKIDTDTNFGTKQKASPYYARYPNLGLTCSQYLSYMRINYKFWHTYYIVLKLHGCSDYVLLETNSSVINMPSCLQSTMYTLGSWDLRTEAVYHVLLSRWPIRWLRSVALTATGHKHTLSVST